MNDLARLAPFVFNGLFCNITDRNGSPWFVAKDVAEILEIKNYREMIRHYPNNEKAYVVCAVSSTDITSAGCAVFSTDGTCDGYSVSGTSGKSRARKTQRILIINESGLMRLILKSRKPNAWEFKERIIKVVSYFMKHGVNWAALPRTWHYGEKELTWTEYYNMKWENYRKLHPNALFEEFQDRHPI